jgi:hypothetical protein
VPVPLASQVGRRQVRGVCGKGMSLASHLPVNDKVAGT